jgi:hypothetical protein
MPAVHESRFFFVQRDYCINFLDIAFFIKICFNMYNIQFPTTVMRNTRSVSIVVCGAVLGVIVGAGSVAFLQNVDVAGALRSTPIRSLATKNYMYHGAPLPYHYTRRRIDAKAPTVSPVVQETSSYSTVRETVPVDPVAVVPSITPCDVATKTAQQIRDVFNRYTAGGMQMRYTEMRMKMEEAFSASVSAYCTPTQDAVQAAPTAPPVAAVDNNCELFPKRSIRYSQCVISEQNGLTYP